MKRSKKIISSHKEGENVATSTTSLPNYDLPKPKEDKEQLLGPHLIKIPEDFDKGFQGSFPPEQTDDPEFHPDKTPDAQGDKPKTINTGDNLDIENDMLDQLYHSAVDFDLPSTSKQVASIKVEEEIISSTSLDVSGMPDEFYRRIHTFIGRVDVLTQSLNHEKGDWLEIKTIYSKNTGKPHCISVIKANYREVQVKEAPETCPNISNSTKSDNSPKAVNPPQVPVKSDHVDRIINDINIGFVWVHKINPRRKRIINLKTEGFSVPDIKRITSCHPNIPDGKVFMFFVLEERGLLSSYTSQFNLMP